MDEFDDFREPPIPKSNPWILRVALFVALGIAGAVFWKIRSDRAEPVVPEQAAVAPVTPAEPTSDPEPQVAPAEIVNADQLFRQLAARSKSALFLSWIKEQNIVQRLAAAAGLVASGKSPASVLGFIEILSPFSAQEFGERAIISPKSYARYDDVTRAFTSLDPAYAAEVYRKLRPFFEAIYAQVAKPGEKFDDVLGRAIDRLVNVRVPDEIEIVPHGGVWAFKDAELESLSPAEKHLLRMGAKNARAIQDMLSAFRTRASIARR